MRMVAVAFLGILIGAGTTIVAATSDGRVDLGDHVTYDIVVRRAHDAAVLFTTDPAFGAAEVSRGNPWIPSPTEAAEFYGPRAGFVVLSNGTAFDHAPFLLGRQAGDSSITPPVRLPVEKRDAFVVPRFLSGVPSTFTLPRENISAILEKENASRESFRYLGELRGRVVPENETHERVFLELSPGMIVSNAVGVPLRVTAVRETEVDLELLLNAGKTFRVGPCAISLGIEGGRYVVQSANETAYTLAHADARDEMAQHDVTLEFHVLRVSDWPQILKGTARAASIIDGIRNR